MVNINCLLLTLVLSFFSVVLLKTVDYSFIEENTSTPYFQDHIAINNSAISVINYNEYLSNLKTFDNTKTEKQFCFLRYLEKVDNPEELHYLKTCNYLNLSLTISNIIYPFHSFL